MDITNNSGAQDTLLQAPQAMAHEDYPCKKEQHGGSTDGQSNRKPLAKGAVKAVQPEDDQLTLTLFLVQKDNGEFRPVINLRALNRFLGKESFKMEGLQVVRSLLQKGDFMMKLDLKDAYMQSPFTHPTGST